MAADAAAAREAAVQRISPGLIEYVTDTTKHQDLHTIITYYDMKKDAHADPSVSTMGNKDVLKPALIQLMGPRIMTIIDRINTENPQYFFYALNRAMENTIYTRVKKIGRLKKDNWENDKLENTLPSFIKYGIEESSRPKNFNKDITTYLSIASYLDPYPSREQTKKAFSYDYRKDEGDKIKISAGETKISGDELKRIGVPGISSIEGTINGYDWTCDTRINFEANITNPSIINNKFNPNFTESGTSDKEYQLGNPTKNKWISIKRGKPSIPVAIKTAKVYLLAKEVGDTCQVMLGNRLADELPKPETSPLGIFAVDTVVGMRTRLTKKMNAIIKNNGDTPLGGLYDEYNLYLCRDDPKTELLSIAQMIHKNTISYNNVIKQKYIDAYGTGFSMPSSRDIGPNHERILDIFQKIVREINIKNALIYIMYQYLVGYIEAFYSIDAELQRLLQEAQAETAAEAQEEDAALGASASAASASASSASAAAAAQDPRIRDIPPLRSIYDVSNKALLDSNRYKNKGIINAYRLRTQLDAAYAAAPAAAHNPMFASPSPEGAAREAAAREAAARAPRIDIRVQYFNSCKREIDKYEEYFKANMKATDLFKHNSKQNTYKLAELEKYIFTDKTPFDTQVRPVGTVLGILIGTKEKYVRRPWNETKSYIDSYTISIGRLPDILFPGAGAGARAAPRPPPPPGDGDRDDFNDNDDNDDNDDDQPITRRNLRLFQSSIRDALAPLVSRPRAQSRTSPLQPLLPSVAEGSLGSGAGSVSPAPPSLHSSLEAAVPRPQSRGVSRGRDNQPLENLRLPDLQEMAIGFGIPINKSNGGGEGVPKTKDDLIKDIEEDRRRKRGRIGNQGGGGAENWDELSGLEITDLIKMNENPNKFLKEKVHEFYGENKDEMYMFSLMNSIYHYLDYVNEITVDRDILDIIKDSYDKLNTLPLETLPFEIFKRGYNEIKQKKIDKYVIVPIPSVNLTRRAQLRRIYPNSHINLVLGKERENRAAAAEKRAAKAVAAATAAVAAAVSPQGQQSAAAKVAAAAATALVTRMEDGAGGNVSDSGSVPYHERSSPAFGSPGPRAAAAPVAAPAKPAAAPANPAEDHTQENEGAEEVEEADAEEAPGLLSRGISMVGPGGSRKYRKTRKIIRGNV